MAGPPPDRDRRAGTAAPTPTPTAGGPAVPPARLHGVWVAEGGDDRAGAWLETHEYATEGPVGVAAFETAAQARAVAAWSNDQAARARLPACYRAEPIGVSPATLRALAEAAARALETVDDPDGRRRAAREIRDQAARALGPPPA